MSKKKTEQPAETQEVKTPDFLAELREKGTVIITAKDMVELAEMINNIPVEVKYGAGAVGFNPKSREYSLRLDLIQ